MSSTDRAKQRVREHVWDLLESNRVVEPGVTGHIPAFAGADEAAERLGSLPAWRSARVIKVNPDRAQLPVRSRALAAGKTVYMAVPRLADRNPFYLLDPAALPVPPEEAAAHRSAASFARTVSIADMPEIDLIVSGSVAVNADGVRIGKGAGYADLEFALLVEAGLVTARTTIVTTVHPLQIVDGPLPDTPHDFRVDVVVTADAVIRCPRGDRPAGLLWDRLGPEKIAAIPALAERVERDGRPSVSPTGAHRADQNGVPPA